jgi:hypothetical protein
VVAVGVAVVALAACGSGGEPVAAGETPTATPTATAASTPVDDVSIQVPPTEEEVATYSDRDDLPPSVRVQVGRDYIVYVLCLGGSLGVELFSRQPPFSAACEGQTYRMPHADGPGEVSIGLSSADGTRWTVAVANVKTGSTARVPQSSK